MKRLIYQIESYEQVYNPVTGAVEQRLSPATVIVKNPADKEIEEAKRTAYKGIFSMEEDGQADFPSAPRNVTGGEYFTVAGVMYQATDNIPVGEPIITGHNALETTVEQQLTRLAKGE